MTTRITRNSPNQPVFTQTEPGWVTLRFNNREYLISAAKAEELLGELKHAVSMARSKCFTEGKFPNGDGWVSYPSTTRTLFDPPTEQ